jgi:hypothetical protein
VLGFFLPFSPPGVVLSLGVMLVLGLARARDIWRLAPWTEPVMAAGLALLAYIVAHTLWTTGLTARSWHAINHYHELLFAPLLFALMSNARHRLIFMRALLTSAVLLALAHWVSLFAPSFAPMLSSRSISAGFVLAVCAFVVLMRARGQARPWPARALAAVPGPDGAAGHARTDGARRTDRADIVCRVAPQSAALALGGGRGKPAACVGVRHERRRAADKTHRRNAWPGRSPPGRTGR